MLGATRSLLLPSPVCTFRKSSGTAREAPDSCDAKPISSFARPAGKLSPALAGLCSTRSTVRTWSSHSHLRMLQPFRLTVNAEGGAPSAPSRPSRGGSGRGGSSRGGRGGGRGTSQHSNFTIFLVIATLHQTVHWVYIVASCAHDQAVQAQCHGHLAEGVTKGAHPEGVAVSEAARLAEGEVVPCGQTKLTPES